VNNIPTSAVPGTNGPWRLLVLSRSVEDPLWLVVSVTTSSDVRAARLDRAGRYQDWPEVTAWVRSVLGRAEVALASVSDPLVWLIDENGQPR
jgi:hypothetical protein